MTNRHAPDRSGVGPAFAATVLSGLEDTMAPGDAASTSAPGTAAGATVARPRYRVEKMLGQGGMGSVLEATDALFGRRVALKELRESPAPVSLVRRFLLEAMVTANLEHPGIAAVHERGVRDGKPFYVMRKLEGRTLSEALSAARTPRERLQFVPAIVRVAQTLAFAHERGVIHRDIKPDNIVLGTHGEVTVIDWGIARVRELDRLAPDLAGTLPAADDLGASQTMDGAVVGTPAYMAPEQAAGARDAMDERTDVFALGALLYHVLSGRPPYEDTTLAAVLVKASTADFPPLRTVAPLAPPRLVSLCEQAMAKSPADRFQSATEMAEALESALTDALEAKPSRWVGAATLAASALLVLLALLGTLLVWRVVPAFREMGLGWYQVLLCTLLGCAFTLIELVTRGRNRLDALLVMFLGMTFIAGLLGAASGLLNVLEGLSRPDVAEQGARWRELLATGGREALTTLVAGIGMGGLQWVLLGITRRSVAARAARTAPP